jgi:hypothetical protein
MMQTSHGHRSGMPVMVSNFPIIYRLYCYPGCIKKSWGFHGLSSLKTITGVFLIENEASKQASKKIID